MIFEFTCLFNSNGCNTASYVNLKIMNKTEIVSGLKFNSNKDIFSN